MFAKRYRPDELIEIIAAQSYSPEIVAYVKRLRINPHWQITLNRSQSLVSQGRLQRLRRGDNAKCCSLYLDETGKGPARLH